MCCVAVCVVVARASRRVVFVCSMCCFVVSLRVCFDCMCFVVAVFVLCGFASHVFRYCCARFCFVGVCKKKNDRVYIRLFMCISINTHIYVCIYA